jgi:hypothetical protein
MKNLPKKILEIICDVEGCDREALYSGGIDYEPVWNACSRHVEKVFSHDKPRMKSSAIEREDSREIKRLSGA